MFTIVCGENGWTLYNANEEVVLDAGPEVSIPEGYLRDMGLSYRVIREEDWRLIHGKLQKEEQSIK